jgi:hypothetical protein
MRAAYVRERNLTRLRLAAVSAGLSLPAEATATLQLPWTVRTSARPMSTGEGEC